MKILPFMGHMEGIYRCLQLSTLVWTACHVLVVADQVVPAPIVVPASNNWSAGHSPLSQQLTNFFVGKVTTDHGQHSQLKLAHPHKASMFSPPQLHTKRGAWIRKDAPPQIHLIAQLNAADSIIILHPRVGFQTPQTLRRQSTI